MNRLFYVTVLSMLLFSCNSYASIQLSATRLIFEGNAKETSVIVKNKGSTRLIQSWLDKDQPEQSVPPFAVTPPLAKLERDDQQLLRVHYAGQGLPNDRESMFWLAVQEIPQKAEGQSVIQLAVQQRIKVFYRPSGLAGKASEAPQSLTLSLTAGQLTLSNPTPYVINLATVEAAGKGLGGEAITPFGQLRLPASGVGASSSLALTIVNDYGAHQRWQAKLVQGKATGLTLAK